MFLNLFLPVFFTCGEDSVIQVKWSRSWIMVTQLPGMWRKVIGFDGSEGTSLTICFFSQYTICRIAGAENKALCWQDKELLPHWIKASGLSLRFMLCLYYPDVWQSSGHPHDLLHWLTVFITLAIVMLKSMCVFYRPAHTLNEAKQDIYVIAGFLRAIEAIFPLSVSSRDTGILLL